MSPAAVTAARRTWREATVRWERTPRGPEKDAASLVEADAFTTYRQASRDYLAAATE